jgi:hypothetical protein
MVENGSQAKSYQSILTELGIEFDPAGGTPEAPVFDVYEPLDLKAWTEFINAGYFIQRRARIIEV